MTQLDGSTTDPPDPRDSRSRETALPADSAAELAGILDEYMAELHAGSFPDRAGLLAAHPTLAAQLEACLAGIEFVHRATGRAPEHEPAALGEFQIVRELGRGGMGVVYEAEQTSLHRRVALKVLRFGAVADQEAMRRFRREAETVARLHHTNIVPIFAVGCDRDVHYYAMQFIEGRSLADVLIEARGAGTPLSPEDVADWGLQAAEALAHAHQRGVIHRDVKPSNLLLDAEGVVWLTDFGLAKRADEAVLTLSGALLGTPRYMSPEQAESLNRPVDHRTDVYSLGATLYELATGQPVFESATPHGVIASILNDQPVRPRAIRPGLPRDLETVILTCLAKDPSERYQTAHALADDLRAVRDERPIRARRVPLAERVTRYVRKRKRAIGVGLTVMAGTALLIVGPFLGWQSYEKSRLGRVFLSSNEPLLTAQVLSESGKREIGEPFAVGSRTIVTLPEDSYRLRVAGRGVLDQTYHFGVNRGELGSYQLSVDDNPLLGQQSNPYAPASTAIEFSRGKADLLEWTGSTLLRRDGKSGKPIWDGALPAKSWNPKRDPIAWMRRLSYLGDEVRPGRPIEPAPDLDHDGTADVVWAFRTTPSLLALSGKDGSMIWTYTAEADGRGGPDPHGPAWPESLAEVPRQGRVMGVPTLRDVDGDGIADVIAAFALFSDGPPILRRSGPEAHAPSVESDEWAHRGRRVVAAISGRTGQSLWSHALDPQMVRIPKHTLDRGPTLIDGNGDATVALVADNQWVGLNPANGQPRSQPLDLGSVPVRPVQYADLDSDGQPDLLALLRGPSVNQQVLTARSCKTGRELWSQTIRANYESPLIEPAPNWPAIVDLDGDGRSEIVVADFGLNMRGEDYRGLRLLDGASGRERWTRSLHPKAPTFAPVAQFTDGLAQLVELPDLDGDGTRDLAAVSRFDGRNLFEQWSIYVDAISGKDGHALWWWHEEFKPTLYRSASALTWCPFLWSRDRNGWPMLAVPLGGTHAFPDALVIPNPHQQPPRVHLLSLATGREVHKIDALSWPHAADLDADGFADLWGSVDGKLRAYRGVGANGPEAWRVLGRFHKASDLNGDGIADVLSDDLQMSLDVDEDSRKPRTAVAHSGRDGRVLWRTPLTYQGPWIEWKVPGINPMPGFALSNSPVPDADLDGDGAAEVFATWNLPYNNSSQAAYTLPLEVLTGKSGRRLWMAGALPLEFPATGYAAIAHYSVRACEPGGPKEVIVRYNTNGGAGPITPGGRPNGPTDHLARLSGRDGRVIWDVPLSDYASDRTSAFPRQYADFDGDGNLDVVELSERNGVAGNYLEMRCISLRDGRTLWSHATPSQGNVPPTLAAGDIDGDGRPEVVIKDRTSGNSSAQTAVIILDGRDSTVRWTWVGGGYRGGLDKKSRDVCLADLAGKGVGNVCVNIRDSQTRQRVVVLDATGKEKSARELKAGSSTALTRADLDGDGRDELLFEDGDRLRAVRGNLQDLWTWPTRDGIREVIPADQGRSVTVVLASMVGLDGATGRPRWDGRGSTALLDPGGLDQPPRLLWLTADATICRLAKVTTSDGSLQPLHGPLVATDPRPPDPRWLRPLPWNGNNDAHWSELLVLYWVSLALVNVMIPLAILKLATRRRIASVRLLLALPAILAILMTSRMELYRSFPLVPFITNTLGGVCILVYVRDVGLSIFNRRWRRLATVVGLTILVASAMAACWLWFDMHAKSKSDYYAWSGWYSVAVIAVLLIGLLKSIAWLGRGLFRIIRRLQRRSAMTPSS